MKQLDSQEQIDELRKRLYSRGEQFSETERHGVSDLKVDVSRDWNIPKQEEVVETEHKPRRYRWYVLIGSFVILLVTGALTGAYMFYGGNQISSDNISINFSGPTTLGGGERLNAQIGVTNQNNVAIESATLIVSYPSGSQTVTEPIENLNEQRIWIDRLEPGEARNVPIDAIVYGEEGDEKEFKAQLEYRIVDSDSLFYKDAEPYKFRVISSPITLQVRSVRKVSSGQEVEVELRIKSNTNTTYENLLVSTSYPNSFAYKSAEPSPSYNQNVWKIDSLKPEETKIIKIKGTVSGLANETLRLNVKVGPSQPDNQFIAGATLTESYTEFVIERPFIDVVIEVNDERKNPVVLEAGSSADVVIEVTNTLDESVYDMVVEVVPSGSALGSARIQSSDGFYDSNTGIIRFETANRPSFGKVHSKTLERLNVSIDPGSNGSTASFSLTVNVYGRRVGESSAEEKLFGTTKLEARYASDISASNSVTHSSGPLPPRVGGTTVYQVELTAAAGTNDVTGGVLKTSLPVYATWLDNYQGEGTVIYNSVSRELEWQIGNIGGGKDKTLRFTMSIQPSSAQVGSKPTLVNRQNFEAKDRFTSSILRATVPEINTEIDNGSEDGDGIVIGAE